MVKLEIVINKYGDCRADVQGDTIEDMVTAWVNLTRLLSQTTNLQLSDLQSVLCAYVAVDNRNQRANKIVRGVANHGRNAIQVR